MPSYILALDQGTTSSRAILFDEQQNIIGIAQKEFTQHYPREGWVEHDPMEIYSSQYAVMMEVIAKSGVEVSDIRGIGITNQRETTILWDAKTGRPVYNAIVWQCRRTADRIDALSKQGLDGYIRQTTGLIPDAYFSATKIAPNPRMRNTTHRRWRTPAGCTWCLPLPDWVRRIGICTPAAASSASPEGPRGNTSSVQRRNRLPTRAMTWSRRWKRIPESRWTA